MQQRALVSKIWKQYSLDFYFRTIIILEHTILVELWGQRVNDSMENNVNYKLLLHVHWKERIGNTWGQDISFLPLMRSPRSAVDKEEGACPEECCCCCSVAKLCLTLCDPMDCNVPGFPDPYYLPEFAQVHVRWIGDAIQPSHPLLPPSPFAVNLS